VRVFDLAIGAPESSEASGNAGLSALAEGRLAKQDDSSEMRRDALHLQTFATEG
jgi:hypothetical protein